MLSTLVLVGFVWNTAVGGDLNCSNEGGPEGCNSREECDWNYAIEVCLGWNGRRLEGAREPTSWSQVEMACRVPFEGAHEIKEQLHNVVDKGLGSSAEAAMAGPVKHIETMCFNIARENIASVGIMFKENPALISQMMDRSIESQDATKASEMLANIRGAKQCLAYIELAKRGNPKALFWAWLNNSGSVGERNEACGDVVNSVNDMLSKNKIPGAYVVESTEIIVVEDFPLGDRIKAAEKQAGLSLLLSKAVAVGSSGALAAGSLLAGICKSWQHMQG